MQSKMEMETALHCRFGSMERKMESSSCRMKKELLLAAWSPAEREIRTQCQVWRGRDRGGECIPLIRASTHVLIRSQSPSIDSRARQPRGSTTAKFRLRPTARAPPRTVTSALGTNQQTHRERRPKTKEGKGGGGSGVIFGSSNRVAAAAELMDAPRNDRRKAPLPPPPPPLPPPSRARPMQTQLENPQSFPGSVLRCSSRHGLFLLARGLNERVNFVARASQCCASGFISPMPDSKIVAKTKGRPDM